MKSSKPFIESKGLKQMVKYGLVHKFLDHKYFEVVVVFIFLQFIINFMST